MVKPSWGELGRLQPCTATANSTHNDLRRCAAPRMAKPLASAATNTQRKFYGAIPTGIAIERLEICSGNSFRHIASNKVRRFFKEHAMTLWLATHASAESTFQLAKIFRMRAPLCASIVCFEKCFD